MRRWFGILAALNLAFAAEAAPPANNDPDWTHCQDRDPAIVMAGCTAILQSADAPWAVKRMAYYNRGRAYAVQRDYDRAIADDTKLIELDPTMTGAFISRGGAYLGKKNYDLALADFDHAVALSPTIAAAFAGRGNVHEARNDFDLAIADYNQAIKLDPGNPAIFLRRAAVLRNIGPDDRALDDLTQALKLKPDYVAALAARAALYADAGNFDKAVADGDTMIRVAPSLESYQARGYLYQLRHDDARAIADFTAAANQKGDVKMAYFFRAVSYLRQGDSSRSDADFAKAQELGVPAALPAQAYLANFQPARAMAVLDRDLKQAPNARSYAQRGSVHRFNGEQDAAIADYTSAVALNPADSMAFAMRALAYRAKGDAAHAQADLDKAVAVAGETIASAPKVAGTWNNRCWIRALGGIELDKAIEDCNTALKRAPDFPLFLDSRAMAQFRLGHYDLALADYDKVVARRPGESSSLLMRGITKIRLGQTEEGHADIAAAVAQSPYIQKQYEVYGITP